MTKTRLVVAVLMSLSLALPVFGKTYKSTYSVPCGEVWGGVKAAEATPTPTSLEASLRLKPFRDGMPQIVHQTIVPPPERSSLAPFQATLPALSAWPNYRCAGVPAEAIL